MNFRTEIQIPKSQTDISYRDNLLLFGSCFTENSGNKLSAHKFKADINPFGILYNPYSIENAINILLKKKQFTEDDLFFHNGIWNSFSHHGSFSDISKEVCLLKINDRINSTSNILKEVDHLLITFGTAWIYELKETNQIVANCHKLPEKTFNRRRLNVKEIADSYTHLLTDIYSLNPSVNIIFTVSPIRHWKDGAHENQLSKSTLLLAIAQLQEKFNNIQYFPAYEIVMDELRDYRFYEEDMLHPSKVAINYIWERFSDTYFSIETKQIQQQIVEICKAQNHRPFNPETEEHLAFLKKTEEKKLKLKAQYPFLDL